MEPDLWICRAAGESFLNAAFIGSGAEDIARGHMP
jgi:hypothetical protein